MLPSYKWFKFYCYINPTFINNLKEIMALIHESQNFWLLHCNESHARLQEMWLFRDNTIEDLSFLPAKNI